MMRICVTTACLLLASACHAGGQASTTCSDAGRDPRADLTLVGEWSIDASSLTPRITLDVAVDTEALLLRVQASLADELFCYQIHSAIGSDGTAYVAPAGDGSDYGPYTTLGTQRAYCGPGYGLYLWPNGGEPADFPETLALRIQVRDCETGLPWTQVHPEFPARTFRVEQQQFSGVAEPAVGTLKLDLVLTPGSEFFGWPDPLSHPELAGGLQRLRTAFATAGVEVEVSAVALLEAPAAVQVRFGPGAYQELDGLYQTAREALCAADRPARSPAVPILFAGCLQQYDALLERYTEPYAMVPRIPGGYSDGRRADGIFLKGRGCLGSATEPYWEADFLGTILAHELGHFLGLYHTVEQDGTTDLLTDTEGDNLMNWTVLDGQVPAFTRQQRLVLRTHPYVSY